MAGFDWRPQRLKDQSFSNSEIDILQFALDVYESEYQGAHTDMDRQDWRPVKDLVRKLEQLRVGH